MIKLAPLLALLVVAMAAFARSDTLEVSGVSNCDLGIGVAMVSNPTKENVYVKDYRVYGDLNGNGIRDSADPLIHSELPFILSSGKTHVSEAFGIPQRLRYNTIFIVVSVAGMRKLSEGCITPCPPK